ncbi:hypothetical protein SAY86_011793 [Trapa natans]|uniref:Secreted protein n=1 Tax=Trapa natans TaxID=22666 RepID=A0AAN7LYU8_TRANT|nr:hypothetical protein SAY86_011793 [Trapa natans]
MVVLFLRSAVLLLWGCMLRETLEKLRIVFMNCALYKSLRWTRETGKMVISQAHKIRQGEKAPSIVDFRATYHKRTMLSRLIGGSNNNIACYMLERVSVAYILVHILQHESSATHALSLTFSV